MIVLIDKSFQKDTAKINDAKIKEALFGVLVNIREADNISSVQNIKKLTGYKDFYRIRLGNYRIGLKLNEDQTIKLIRFLHRKDIYKNWP